MSLLRRGLALRVAVILAAVLTAAHPACATEEELVPAGAFTVRAQYSVDEQSQGWGTDGRIEPLQNYLVPNQGVQQELNGTVTRRIAQTTLFLQAGLADTWNLSLTLPYQEIRQDSSLATSSADPRAAAAVRQFSAATVSGMGDLRLASLHRALSSDHDGVILGYGINWPSESQGTDYIGMGTLAVRSAYTTLFGLAHYTHYARLEGARLDLRAEIQGGQGDKVHTPDWPPYSAGTLTINPGNTFIVTAAWEQEFAALDYALQVGYLQHNPDSLVGGPAQDLVKEYSARVQLGWGNLYRLFSAPLAWPTQALLIYETTINGFNTPIRNRIALSLQTYF